MTERLPFHFSLSCIGEGNGNPLQCSCLENPRDGRAWAAVYGIEQSWSWLKWLSMHWRRKWQPTPVFLPGESQGQRSLVGCRLWGPTESDTMKRLSSSSIAEIISEERLFLTVFELSTCQPIFVPSLLNYCLFLWLIEIFSCTKWLSLLLFTFKIFLSLEFLNFFCAFLGGYAANYNYYLTFKKVKFVLILR